MRSSTIVGGEPLVMVPVSAYVAIKTKSRLPYVTSPKPVAEVRGEAVDFFIDKTWVTKRLKGAIFVG